MTETVFPPPMNPLYERRLRSSMGRPVPGAQVRLVGEDGRDLGVGDAGELWVRGEAGATVMSGYLDNPAATSETLAAGRLHTGDVARTDADGVLFFVDRAKDMIKRAGENVSCAEVEAVVEKHPAVFEAAAVGVPDEVRDEALHVFVVLPAGATVAEVLDDEVRKVLCPDKVTTDEWLEVHRTAHAVGLRSNVTVMFGSVERPVYWARHLLRTRALQHETGGFTEFVPLPFVHMAAPVYLKRGGPPGTHLAGGRADARRRPHRVRRCDRPHPGLLGEDPSGGGRAAAAGRGRRPRRHPDGGEHQPGGRRRSRPGARDGRPRGGGGTGRTGGRAAHDVVRPGRAAHPGAGCRMTREPVEHWTRQFRERVGVDEREVSLCCDDLVEFCRARAVSPADLLARWEDFPELLVRRRPEPGAPPHRSVESFLIHNGVHVFGDITCAAGRPEDLALQGPQFVRHIVP